MSLDSIIWLVLPMLALIAAAVIRPKREPSRRSVLVGIILSAILVAFYTIGRP
jgi:thiol:disulfide interchange protein